MAKVGQNREEKGLMEEGRRGWETLKKEYCYWIPDADIEGEIPVQLHGTFFRNGPGLNEVYGKRLKHRKNRHHCIIALTPHSTSRNLPERGSLVVACRLKPSFLALDRHICLRFC